MRWHVQLFGRLLLLPPQPKGGRPACHHRQPPTAAAEPTNRGWRDATPCCCLLPSRCAAACCPSMSPNTRLRLPQLRSRVVALWRPGWPGPPCRRWPPPSPAGAPAACLPSVSAGVCCGCPAWGRVPLGSQMLGRAGEKFLLFGCCPLDSAATNKRATRPCAHTRRPNVCLVRVRAHGAGKGQRQGLVLGAKGTGHGGRPQKAGGGPPLFWR